MKLRKCTGRIGPPWGLDWFFLMICGTVGAVALPAPLLRKVTPRDPSTSSKGTWTLQTHPKHLLRGYLDSLGGISSITCILYAGSLAPADPAGAAGVLLHGKKPRYKSSFSHSQASDGEKTCKKHLCLWGSLLKDIVINNGFVADAPFVC